MARVRSILPGVCTCRQATTHSTIQLAYVASCRVIAAATDATTAAAASSSTVVVLKLSAAFEPQGRAPGALCSYGTGAMSHEEALPP
jgi:precorrin-2 methylase